MSLRCFAFRGLITWAQIWKSFLVQNSTSLLYLPIPSLAETWKIFTNKLYQFFFLLSWHFKWEKSVFWKASFCNTRTDLILMQDFVYKTFTLQLVRISLLISAITKSFVCFLGKVILFLHSRGGKNSRQLCKPETFFVSGLYNCIKFSHHPSCLYQAMQTWKTFSIA